MRIGFIGLGKMGAGMAHNLIGAGHEMAVYNRSREKAQPLAEEGARIADTPADACRGAEAVFTMLADDNAVRDVTLGNGIIASLESGAAHISSSTISLALSRQLAEEHGQRRQNYFAAPVFGRPEAARSKQLLVIAAGDGSLIDRFRPVLDALGRRTFVVGAEPWRANAFKLCGNFMIASMLETFSEAFTTARKAQIDHHLFLEVMNELFGSPVYKNYGQTMADAKFDPAGFALRLGLKDVRLMLEASDELGSPMPFASVVRDHLISAVAHGQENLDWCSLVRVLERSAGIGNDSGRD